MNNEQLTNGKLASFVQTLPTRLIALRKSCGLTQKETAKLLGVSGFAISQWENGGIPNGPNRQRLQKLFADIETEKPRQATIPFDRHHEPKQYVLHRPEAAPLRFTGFELGSLLLSDNGTLNLYRTKSGLVVWEYGGFVFHGPVDEFVKNWHHSADAGDVFSFANECGFEIYEDIE